MIELKAPLSAFAAGVEGHTLIAEMKALSPVLPLLLAISTRGDEATLLFDTNTQLTIAELAIVDAAIAAHDGSKAQLELARKDLRALIGPRLDELKFLRDNAAKTDAKLDAEAAAVDLAVATAPDEATARALVAAYLRQPL